MSQRLGKKVLCEFTADPSRVFLFGVSDRLKSLQGSELAWNLHLFLMVFTE